ncbi:hypothetical protein [Pseudorhizobium pelagicum]|uniref:hypothetical protein n=1 Tax=Pseudorhizobium pelagicum TaxID=1509405 RepID=UPI00055A7392|nr:hypothetical protein [Pseudorhizobium pelagicum]
MKRISIDQGIAGGSRLTPEASIDISPQPESASENQGASYIWHNVHAVDEVRSRINESDDADTINRHEGKSGDLDDLFTDIAADSGPPAAIRRRIITRTLASLKAYYESLLEWRDERRAQRALDAIPLDLRKDLGWPDLSRHRRRKSL